MVVSLPDDTKNAVIGDTPLNRLGRVDDIVEVVAFIASDRSSFMTGEVIDVNGGKDL